MLKRKYRPYLLAGLLIVVIALGLGLYFGLRRTEVNNGNKSAQVNISTGGTSASEDLIFPDIHQEDFYDYIEIRDGVAIITDELISAVVNFVINNAQVANDDILWEVTPLSEDRRDVALLTFALDKEGFEDNPAFTRSYKLQVSRL